MRFDIVTIFPKIFDSYFNESIINRARRRKIVDILVHDLRRFSTDKHKKVDDKPYGGGAGMVLTALPILRAVDYVIRQVKNKKFKTKIVVFSAKGRQYDQKIAYNWSKKYDHLILISGRYEGIDERVRNILRAEEISIGPYVLTDGEVPAMVMVSSLTRFLPGVIKWESLQEESYWHLLLKKEESEIRKGKLLEYPHYTRPEIIEWKSKKYRVPKVLLSGDKEKVDEWRRKHVRAYQT